MFRVTTDVSCPAAKAIDEAINPDINAQLEEAVEGGLDDKCQDIDVWVSFCNNAVEEQYSIPYFNVCISINTSS